MSWTPSRHLLRFRSHYKLLSKHPLVSCTNDAVETRDRFQSGTEMKPTGNIVDSESSCPSQAEGTHLHRDRRRAGGRSRRDGQRKIASPWRHVSKLSWAPDRRLSGHMRNFDRAVRD